jgi:hypothetical protein
MSSRLLRGSAVSVFAVLACAGAARAASPTIDFDPDARFAEFHTFRFVATDGAGPGTGVVSNPELRRALEERLAVELEERGLRRASETEEADLAVRWWSGVESSQTVDRIAGFELFVSGEWSSIYARTLQENVGEVVLVIDLIDAREGKLAWRALLPIGVSDPARTRERAVRQVERALDRYPPGERERNRRRAARERER